MKKQIMGFAVLALFLLGSVPCSAATVKTILDNGLTVLVTEMPASPVAAIHVWVKTGSANEGRFIGSGITHFVEHMLFKGTAKRPVGVIPQEARAMGGYINASTGYDHTVYIFSVPKENFARAIDLLADMVTAPAFDPVELEREREVILKEMNMLEDRPDRKLDELVYKTVYRVHPYQFSIIGRPDVFRALEREDLVEYHRTLYVPNNMIVSVAGGVAADEALALVGQRFGGLPARSFPLRNLPQEPEQIFPRRLEVPYATDLVRLSMAYQSVALLDPDLYALDVLAMVIGQGESSRLYVDLYKKRRIVESVSSTSNTPQDRGFFEISCLIRDKDPEQIIRIVKGMIRDVQEKGLLPDELEKVKRQVMVNNIYARQTAEGMSGKAAQEEGFAGDPDFSERYLEGIRSVTNEDVRNVARKYLIEPRLSVVILRPEKEIPAAGASEVLPKGEIERLVLSNGMVLLLREDHSLPIVSVTAAFNGGARQEPEGLEGLFTLAGSVWTKGLPGESSEQIRARVESRGADVSSSSGRNSFLLSMTFMAEDRRLMFDYLEKMMTVPSFPEKEISRDKDQLMTALVARRDSVVRESSQALNEALFLTHPLRKDGLGSPESLKKVTRRMIVDVFQQHIRSDNGVIAVFGDIDRKSIVPEMERCLSRLKKGRPELKVFSEEAPVATRVKELFMDKEQAAVLFGFRGPLIRDEARYAVDVAVNILSSSLGGRIFQRVREDLGKAYGTRGWFSPGVDAGMIGFLVLTTDESLDRVRAIMQEEFEKIRTGSVTEQELADAKAYLVGDMARSLQTSGAQASTRALDELLGLGYRNVDGYADHINAVTVEDVKEVAQEYLDIAHAAVVLTRPFSKKTGE